MDKSFDKESLIGGDKKGAIPSSFDMISLTVASPDDIESWSYGEVKKSETINYRTQKPERDGLFCEKIFGPTKNWECYCGKYKKIKHKNLTCDKCGVDVTHSSVRRERMGHIALAVPVSHIWYVRSTPSRIGLLLDLSIKNLEQVIYFAGYIIKNINETARTEALEALKEEFTREKKNIQTAYQAAQNKKALAERGVEEQESGDETEADADAEKSEDAAPELLTQDEYARQLDELTEEYNEDKKRLESLHVYQILSELEYRELSMFYGHVFQAGTGSEAVRDAISDLDLEKLLEDLTEQIRTSSGQRKTKLMKRLLLVENLVKGEIKPEWMILTHIPILPPELRPMVALEGGRFAASDLNDLYRRIINRNNRLKRLLSIGAPEVICRNEKRMLQEAVDALINNSARGAKAVTKSGAGRLTLKSLSDSLKGKQGRFRQNLLGKRVDYSGRSVIVVGPKLKLNQCGLPKRMALELFKPFVISKLLREGFAYNAKNAEKLIEWDRPEVWDKLDEVIKNRYVLLNRAPTLHRLGIQAFQPVLIEGKAIQIHPLVCSAFNADFDGDQMAVHVPLSTNAQKEAAEIMSAAKNILKPSEGKPILSPTQDMILGCYYLTSNDSDEVADFTAVNIHEAITAYRLGHIGLRQMIKARIEDEIIETTAGRMIFNSFLPDELGFINKTFRKKDLSQLIADIYESMGTDTTALVVDEIKRIGFKFATKSGISIAYSDIKVPEEKKDIVKETEKKVMEIREHYMNGLYTVNERSRDTVAAWMDCKNKVSDLVVDQADKKSSIFYMIDSAARGTWGNMAQMGAMKGNVTSSTGRTIELPVKASFKEGFETLEYFISTHSGRKGKTDTALKTATAGYLTRRLVDAVQDIIIRENDCQNAHGIIISKAESDEIGEKFENRILGRTLAVDLKVDGKVYLEKGHIISPDDIKDMEGKDIPEVEVRSILTCRTRKGICASCYGYDLSNNKPVEIGTAVGIIAAQSIGEPGTQLTMRTFHSGGTADSKDITQGLPRVEELFEIRNPKTEAQIAGITGKATIEYEQDAIVVRIKANEKGFDEYTLLQDMEAVVEEGELVKEKQVLSRIKGGKDYVKAKAAGKVRITEDAIFVDHTEFVEEEHKIDLNEELLVSEGEEVEAGQPLHRGHLNIKNLIDATDFITAQKYIMSEVQKIYATQGETVNDKHIEIIIRQIFSKARILDPGESGFIPGEVKDVNDILHTNYDLVKNNKKPIISQRMTLGLTRVSLETESWLSAASFQETIRTLVKASVTRQVDRLEGLKENVIIGKLLPSGAHFKKMYEANIQGESNLEDLEEMEEEKQATLD